mmetsp:Transcript_13315/g.16036  ORF Transcript_13315/g.16036 Transcript_13315/m.16036 type:complete len:127 (+) Transcript_13315:571-951(+)
MNDQTQASEYITLIMTQERSGKFHLTRLRKSSAVSLHLKKKNHLQLPKHKVRPILRHPLKVKTRIQEKDSRNTTKKTLDGYTVIQDANSRESRDEELQAMRAARQRNRLGQSAIEMKDIGAQKMTD